MVHSKPIVRSHDRLKKGVNRDPRGERFHLQGARWRFPKDLELSEVEARIGRIKELWKDLERIFETAVYVDISTAAERDSLVLEDTVAHIQVAQRKATFDIRGELSLPIQSNIT